MKKVLFNLALCFVTTLVITACQNDDRSRATGPPSTPVAPATNQPAATAPGTVNAGVEHYICPAGHVGYGSSAQGNCSQCGVALVHNQAFHNNTAAAPTQSPPMFQNPPAGTAPAATIAPPAEPAQNAAGVWHYTCIAGCAGGAGGSGSCSNCGSALAHNQAYHN
ncbi:MAG: hypothetical protein AAFP77_10420 [Bacteroidota bacterium]